jgi:ATPase subunit of ABC transporter with duplicated ATPase domains
MWAAMTDRDAIYANPEATEDDYMRAAELEGRFAEYDGYTAEARAGELLLGLEIPVEQHQLPMREIAPGWKLRVLLAQALFSNPDVLLLDEPTNNLDINTIRWLETVLNGYDSTMIIISHDRHFLNAVCTHMADLDYGELRVYPGNYDDYMLASTQARERQVAANARAKERVSELQDFVRRFAANKSKSRQATSRLKQIDRIKSETIQVKPSSRQNPYIRFEVNKVLHRQAVHIEELSKSYDRPIIRHFSAMIEAGQKVAIIGANGVGKTTLLRMLAGNLPPDEGHVRWSENADIGYMAQDVSDQFDSDRDLFDWLSDYRQPGDEDQSIRSVLGRLLFSGDEITKPVRVLSGGEKNRMSFGRLMLGRHNVMLMDEPTNHLDMESIESLQYALEQYKGTLVFVSHDRQFVSGVATRVIEILPGGQLNDYPGTYEEYLSSQGIED